MRGHRPSSGKGRLQTDIHRLLCVLMQRDMDDPVLLGVGITRLEFSKANDVVNVFVHRMHEEHKQACVMRLQRLAPRFEHALRKALPKRQLPSLVFHWDDVFDASGAVLDTLRELSS